MAVTRVLDLTAGSGAHTVLECVGCEESTMTALSTARPGGAVGRVGLPQVSSVPAALPTCMRKVTVGGGVAPARAYSGGPSPMFWKAGRIRADRVCVRVATPAEVPGAYRAMSEREAVRCSPSPEAGAPRSGTGGAARVARRESEVYWVNIKRTGSQAAVVGTPDRFDGAVRIEPLFDAMAPARVSGARVTFEAGARTAWHSHPRGQTLIVTGGSGLTQCWGGPVEEIRPGDVIQVSAGEKHWHGATPTAALTHIAIQEHLDGKTADWMEHVSDAEYRAR